MAYFNIIIRCYNCANTIDRLLGSIESQTFKDFTVTCADDASTDGTYEKIEQWKQRIPITLVRNSVNSYPGATSNLAMDNSPESEYTMVIDSDDELYADDVLGKIHDAAVEHPDDVLVMDYVIVHMDGKTERWDYSESERRDMFRYVDVYPWVKCVRTSKLVRFFPGLNNDDGLWTVRLLESVDSIYATGIVWYKYILRDNSYSDTRNAGFVVTKMVNTLDIAMGMPHSKSTVKYTRLIRNSVNTIRGFRNDLPRLLAEGNITRYVYDNAIVYMRSKVDTCRVAPGEILSGTAKYVQHGDFEPDLKL